MKKIEFFKVEGDKINRFRKYCPKCGPGIFLAEHKNRFSCGKCGYTEFKGGGKPARPKPVEEKPVEASQGPPKEELPKEEASFEPAAEEEKSAEESSNEEKKD